MNPPKSQKQNITRGELSIGLVLITMLAGSAIAFGDGILAGSQQTKQVNAVKQIGMGCQLFAADYSGLYPNGKFDPATGKFTEVAPADSAEACFNDLLESKIFDVERLFWLPQQTIQCAEGAPDENGTLVAGENYWDYNAGLHNSCDANFPLVFEASDGGTGTKWSKEGGHPWDTHVIVGYVDGSAEKLTKNAEGGLKREREGVQIDICVPTPGTNRWPAAAKIAPATPKG